MLYWNIFPENTILYKSPCFFEQTRCGWKTTVIIKKAAPCIHDARSKCLFTAFWQLIIFQFSLIIWTFYAGTKRKVRIEICTVIDWISGGNMAMDATYFLSTFNCKDIRPIRWRSKTKRKSHSPVEGNNYYHISSAGKRGAVFGPLIYFYNIIAINYVPFYNSTPVTKFFG